MDFELDEDQRMLQALVQRFVSDRYGQVHGCDLNTTLGYDEENWRLLGELGLLALPLSFESVPTAQDSTNLITMMECLGYGLSAEPVLEQVIVAGGLLALTGSSAQKEKWLEPLTTGSSHAGLAFAEANARWSFADIETKMGSSGLVGSKTFAPANVDFYVVTAKQRGRVRLFLVDAMEAGLTSRRYRAIDGSWVCELAFDDVPAEPLDGGLAELQTVIDMGRLGACAEMLGIANRQFETTVDYVGQRKQFGAAIGSFQAIQHRLADLYVALEQARSQLYRATVTQGDARPAAIAAAKVYISEMALKLGEECIQFHGGMGVSSELNIGRGLKRTMLLSRLFGDVDHEIQRYSVMVAGAGSVDAEGLRADRNSAVPAGEKVAARIA